MINKFFFSSCLSLSFFLVTPCLLNAQQTATTDTVKAAIVTDENKIVFEKPEVEASVNATLWRQHLESELQGVIGKAAKKGMKAGSYTVNVRFLVEKDGSITDVKALNDFGYGIAEGVVKVVSTGPRWKAGISNGQKVRSYHTQPITFVITEK